jgi:hypothetical protein
MAKPTDTALYNKIKLMANDVFDSPTGIYRSMWIQKQYKAAGGEYDKPKTNSKTKRWLKEEWIDLNQPIKKVNKIMSYRKCGSKNTQNNLYPLCRPSKTISKDTPRTYQTIDPKDIKKANRKKQILRNTGNTTF